MGDNQLSRLLDAVARAEAIMALDHSRPRGPVDSYAYDFGALESAVKEIAALARSIRPRESTLSDLVEAYTRCGEQFGSAGRHLRTCPGMNPPPELAPVFRPAFAKPHAERVVSDDAIYTAHETAHEETRT